MSHNVDDLRAHLFATIEGLRAGTVTIETARAISDVSQTIINSAKVEVEAARLVEGATAPRFLGGANPAHSDTPALPPGITGIRQHRIAG
jgi:hypothetical protein